MLTTFNFHIGENFISAADIVPTADVRETTFLAYLLKERGYAVSRIAENCIAVMLSSEEEAQNLNEEIYALLDPATVLQDKTHYRTMKQIESIYLSAMRRACAEMWSIIEPNLREEEIVIGVTGPSSWDRFRFVYPKSVYEEDWKQHSWTFDQIRAKESSAAPTK